MLESMANPFLSETSNKTEATGLENRDVKDFMLAGPASALLRKLQGVTSAALSFRLNYHSLAFNYLLFSCSSLLDLKRIHALILTHGSGQNLPVSTKLVTLASTFAPNMDYARNMFDVMLQRDVFLWNTLIRGYADLGPCIEAIVLYQTMHQTGMLPDNYTFPFVVRSCAVLSALRVGKEVHCNIIKNGFSSDVFVQSSLVSMYAQSGETLNSEIVFGEMSVKNIVSWTAMISGYVQNGYLKEGLGVFREMVGLGTRPNAITLVSTLPACASLEFLNLGKVIHGYGVKLGIDSYISVMNALIAFYGKCGYIDVARLLFEEMEFRSLVSWNVMISTYEQMSKTRNALKLFRRMQTEKVKCDYITMVSVISACASLGALDIGKWLHNLVKRKGFETNISITNALIDMYAKCGNLELAKAVFKRLPYKSVISWTSIIGACASHGHGRDALDFFDEMKREGIRPNSFTFVAVLTACRHSGLVEEGRRYFGSMIKEYKIVPSLEHCACLVDLLGRSGCLEEAYSFIQSMPVEPDVNVWGALLGSCKIHVNVELAELVSERLFRLDPESVTFYVLMSNIYAEAARWDDVTKLRNLIREKELKKLPGHSLVEVNKKFHKFLSGSRQSPSEKK